MIQIYPGDSAHRHVSFLAHAEHTNAESADVQVVAVHVASAATLHGKASRIAHPSVPFSAAAKNRQGAATHVSAAYNHSCILHRVEEPVRFGWHASEAGEIVTTA